LGGRDRCQPGAVTNAHCRTIKLPPDNARGTLKPGAGLDVVQSNCATCHSTDYIVRQPGGDAKHWEPEIRKMMMVYGAQISDSDVETIANYLGTEYGTPPVTEPGEAQNANKARQRSVVDLLFSAAPAPFDHENCARIKIAPPIARTSSRSAIGRSLPPTAFTSRERNS